MSASEFESALHAPAESNTYRRLYQLLSRVDGTSTDRSLANTAENFFHSFCNRSIPPRKRRWIGIALHRLIRFSKPAVNRLKTIPIVQLGQVIMDKEEKEGPRLIAGMIMHQLRLEGIQHAAFWPSQRVPANIFPLAESQSWAQDFQDFLHVLTDLQLLPDSVDATVLYVVSISGSDGFKLMDSLEYAMTFFVEDDYLTVFLPPTAGRTVHFVDVPIRHITRVEIQESKLHDSQGRESAQKPWDLVLTLRSSTSWTYMCNASERKGDQVRIMFMDRKEAVEAHGGIKAAQATLPSLKMSSSHMIDITRSEDTPGHQNITGSGPATSSSISKPNAATAGSVPEATEATSPAKRSRALPKGTARPLPATRTPASVSETFGDTNNEQIMPHDEYNLAERTTKPAVNSEKGLPKAPTKPRPTVMVNSDTAPSNPEPFQVRRVSSQSVDKSKDPEAASSSSKKLPKIMKQKTTSRPQKKTTNVFDIPSDDKPKTTRRTRRKVSKPINYEEDEEADDGVSESDYMENEKKPKPGSSKKKANRKSEKGKSKPKNGPATKLKANMQKEGTQHLTANPTSSAKDKSVFHQSSALRTNHVTTSPKQKTSQNQCISNIQDHVVAQSDIQSPESGSVSPSRPMIQEEFIVQFAEDAHESEPDYEALATLCSPSRSLPSQTITRPLEQGTTPKPPQAVSPKINGTTTHPVSAVPSNAHKRSMSPGDMPSTPHPKRMKYIPTNPVTGDIDETNHPLALDMAEISTPSRNIIAAVSPRPGDKNHKNNVNVRPTAGTSMGSLVHSLFDTEGVKQFHSNQQSPSPARNSDARRGKSPYTRTQLGKTAVEPVLSNSKPRPASPHAESNAISGHLPNKEVEMDIEMAAYRTAQNDPFQGHPMDQKRRMTAFNRHLTDESLSEEPRPRERSPDLAYDKSKSKTYLNHLPEDDTGATHRKANSESPSHIRGSQRKAARYREAHAGGGSIQHTGAAMDIHIDVDEDETLIPEYQPNGQKDALSPVPSSPPSSSSSRSSTSADPSDDEPEIPPEDAFEEKQWVEAMEPHHRPIHDALIHLSKLVVRHIVDKETAIRDIVDMFERDGTLLIRKLSDRHRDDLELLFIRIDERKGVMKNEYARMAQKLAKDREALMEEESSTGET